MIDDIILTIASVLLSVSIIPQLLMNFKTKNVASHCIYWHITNLIGYSLLIYIYSKYGFYVSIGGICLSGCFRVTMIWQILNYKKLQPISKPDKRWV